VNDLAFKSIGQCLCPKAGPQDVLVRIDGEPDESEYCVSITCARCRRPWFLEKTAEVVADEIPMTLKRTIEDDGQICYDLTARAR
jgi:hypothetical protein